MTPLAETLRPQTLNEVVGQAHLLEEGSLLRRFIEEKKPISLLFWGPPGSGKTTLAKLYAKALKADFFSFSAVSSSISDLKNLLKLKEEQPLLYSKLVVFCDEIHRYNKAQQDLFLPYLENGSLILIGATTENPSFCLNNALLSRLRVFPLKPLTSLDLQKLLEKALTQHELSLSWEAQEFLIQEAKGDARSLFNQLENLLAFQEKSFDLPALKKCIQKKGALFDKGGEFHYNLISALHKSIRTSDAQAALYWLSRLLEGGVDPLYIARRLLRVASEDIGLADPQALQQAFLAYETFNRLVSPEGELALAQAVVYLSLSPKSNALYTAFRQAKEISEKTNHLPPPSNFLNAPTAFMESMGYGEGYQYDHDCPDAISSQKTFPEGMTPSSFYFPKDLGFERELKKRIHYFESKRKKFNSK